MRSFDFKSFSEKKYFKVSVLQEDDAVSIDDGHRYLSKKPVTI